MRKFLVSTAALVVLSPLVANAEPILLDQDNDVGGGSAFTVATGFTPYQTFAVGLDGILSLIEVNVIRRPDAVEDLFVAIYGVASGLPSSILGEVAFDPTNVPADGWLGADVSSFGINVLVGDMLAIVLRSDAANDPPYNERYLWREGQSYDGGTSFLGGRDLAFRTYVDTAQVPEPGTLALLGAGLIGMGFARRRS